MFLGCSEMFKIGDWKVVGRPHSSSPLCRYELWCEVVPQSGFKQNLDGNIYQLSFDICKRKITYNMLLLKELHEILYHLEIKKSIIKPDNIKDIFLTIFYYLIVDSEEFDLKSTCWCGKIIYIVIQMHIYPKYKFLNK